ncbi:MAG: helix-turn-helix domain-containing protein [candidate division Zixibacteria bacterium]|nr:helix-turn-helix domain-containing protein [candidate division Zixibacteria bacterium]
MVEKIVNKYEPDYVSPPGETLVDVLESLEMPQVMLATRMGRPTKTINEIIKGRTAITPDTALQLEKVLGIPASFWNNRERQFREFLSKVKETRSLEGQMKWFSLFPVREMMQLGWINKVSRKSAQLVELLKFFRIAEPKQWKRVWSFPSAVFRKSKAFQSNRYALSVWLRQGEIEVEQIDCKDFNSDTFKAMLSKIRTLTNESPNTFMDKMMELCALAGVAVVFVPEIRGARVCGATRWLTQRKALIQLSLRYKTNDHLWFTFFHEAGHILRHGKKDLFIEGIKDDNPLEAEADEFSRNLLIDDKLYREFVRTGDFSRGTIKSFADRIGIAPGIVVGRLQHDKHIEYSFFNDLKVKYRWAKSE